MTPPPDGGIRCMLMRGGTSKALYFLAADLPTAPDQHWLEQLLAEAEE